MIYNQNRDAFRQSFVDVLKKVQIKELLSPLESIIANVLADHPEYHSLLKTDAAVEFADQQRENPFYHMGLHISVVEQVQNDHPKGIRSIFQSLAISTQDRHRAEHQMMRCLSNALGAAMQTGKPPDESQYLQCLKSLATK